MVWKKIMSKKGGKKDAVSMQDTIQEKRITEYLENLPMELNARLVLEGGQNKKQGKMVLMPETILWVESITVDSYENKEPGKRGGIKQSWKRLIGAFSRK